MVQAEESENTLKSGILVQSRVQMHPRSNVIHGLILLWSVHTEGINKVLPERGWLWILNKGFKLLMTPEWDAKWIKAKILS